MNKENLRLWIGKHFYQPTWIKDDEVTVSCPFHKEDDTNCKCHINIETKQYYCDKSKSPEDIKELFKYFHEDFPKDDKFIQINNYYYIDRNGKYVITSVASMKANGNMVYYSRPKGVRRHVLYNLPEVLKKASQGEITVWVKGESKVKALKRYGITATTTIGAVRSFEDILECIRDLPKDIKIMFYENENPKYYQYFETVEKALHKVGIDPDIVLGIFIDFTEIDYWIKDGKKKLEEAYNNNVVYYEENLIPQVKNKEFEAYNILGESRYGDTHEIIEILAFCYLLDKLKITCVKKIYYNSKNSMCHFKLDLTNYSKIDELIALETARKTITQFIWIDDKFYTSVEDKIKYRNIS